MATTPRTNTEFWLNKFSRNMERDNNAQATLRRAGYRVLTFWQCELVDPDAGKLKKLACLRAARTYPSRPHSLIRNNA